MSTLGKQPHVIAPEEREKIVEQVSEALKERSEIVFAYLFGSFAEGSPFRDIDVAVWVEGIDKEQVWDYETELAIDLTKTLGIEVDVRLLNFAPVGFCINAVKGILLLSRDDELRLAFIERISRLYMDFSWLARQMLKEALR